MNRIEREYKNALDEVRFSQEAKERMMNNLMNQKEQAPVKRHGFRPLRTGLIAAALCLALVGTAGAATLVLRQANIHFWGDWDEYMQAQQEKSEEDGVDYGVVAGVAGLDYDELSPFDMDSWWNGKDTVSGGAYTAVSETEGVIGVEGILGEAEVRYDPTVQTLVEESNGAAEDGWTAKRVFQYEWDGQTYLTARYRAEALSGYDGLWNGWDTAWLEDRYTSVPDHMMFEGIERNGKPYRTNIFGEFRGEGDTVFNVQYSWESGIIYGDQDYLREEYDHVETYTTADGVRITIMTAPSNSGKTLFWAEMLSGGGFFSMFGTQMELDDLHRLLDSLELSRLVGYDPLK